MAEADLPDLSARVRSGDQVTINGETDAFSLIESNLVHGKPSPVDETFADDLECAYRFSRGQSTTD